MVLTGMQADLTSNNRTGKTVRHLIPGLLRQSFSARLAGYEDTDDHEYFSRDPAIRGVKEDGCKHAIESIQPCLKGRNRARISALGGIYGPSDEGLMHDKSSSD